MSLFNEYAKWTSTVAQYPITAEAFYLALGIADECGELINAPRREVVAEGGDVLWYCARYAIKVLEVPFSDVVADSSRLHAVCSVTQNVGIICGVEKKRIRDGESWDNPKRIDKHAQAYSALVHIVHFVDYCLKQSGYTLEDAITANMTKLDGRLSAGTIKGDGDHR
jgi:hypothetical protein